MQVSNRDIQLARKLRRQVRTSLLIPPEVYHVLRVLNNIRKTPPILRKVIFELDGVRHTFPRVIPPIAVQKFAELLVDGADIRVAADIVGMPLIRPKPKLDADDRVVVLNLLVNLFKAEWRRRGFA